MKVYQVYYDSVETYCSPYQENWKDERRVIATTLDKEYAEELMAEHNKVNAGKYENGRNKRAYIATFDLVNRP
jgi:hypothetical protein